MFINTIWASSHPRSDREQGGKISYHGFLPSTGHQHVQMLDHPLAWHDMALGSCCCQEKGSAPCGSSKVQVEFSIRNGGGKAYGFIYGITPGSIARFSSA